MPLPRSLAALPALFLFAGCAALPHARQSCALLVIVDGNLRLATPQQVAYVEQRVAPLLADRQLVLSHDRSSAAFLAQVELTTDPRFPEAGDFVVRSIDPNPLRGQAARADENAPTPAERDAQRRGEQFDRSLYEEGRKSGG
jgi:hypothetical protein